MSGWKDSDNRVKIMKKHQKERERNGQRENR